MLIARTHGMFTLCYFSTGLEDNFADLDVSSELTGPEKKGRQEIWISSEIVREGLRWVKVLMTLERVILISGFLLLI